MSETRERVFESCMFNSSLLVMLLFQTKAQTYMLKQSKSKTCWQAADCRKFAFATLVDVAPVAPEIKKF